ncbi:hypothetical protein M3649_07485 [Ureibacillus chungkukjangi]|uniref:hypothetical protein n=1 Tax=Ureibacillus chungkukjangi TaxID=1202712 RepID=UPI002041B562|nr:hypothetical protein [Ureibacillus chungkukjangi]MCM3387976.1 hypothetical protein [Ureibacillus chungkukjangi]
MEGIIMMAVLFIISSILNGAKKKQQNSKEMPPFINQPTKQKFELPKQTEIRKSLEDFASEVFQQLNDKAQPIQTTPPKDPEPKKVAEHIKEEVVAERATLNTRPIFDGNRSSNRGSAIKTKSSKPSDEITQGEIGSIVPTTRSALVQAIITTEILGPPKAKQR